MHLLYLFTFQQIKFYNFFITDTILMGYFQCRGGCFNRSRHSFFSTLCEYFFLISFSTALFSVMCVISLPLEYNKIFRQLSIKQEITFMNCQFMFFWLNFYQCFNEFRKLRLHSCILPLGNVLLAF